MTVIYYPKLQVVIIQVGISEPANLFSYLVYLLGKYERTGCINFDATLHICTQHKLKKTFRYM